MSEFIAVDHGRCTGCRCCEMVCSLYHFGECNPEKSAIRVTRKEKDGLVSCLPIVCQQCEEAPCLEVCSTGALSRENARDTITIARESCSGCGDCVAACPAGCIFLDNVSSTAICCDLCGGQPQCVDLCHSHCLTRGSGEGAGVKDRVERLAQILEEDFWESKPEKGGL